MGSRYCGMATVTWKCQFHPRTREECAVCVVSRVLISVMKIPYRCAPQAITITSHKTTSLTERVECSMTAQSSETPGKWMAPSVDMELNLPLRHQPSRVRRVKRAKGKPRSNVGRCTTVRSRAAGQSSVSKSSTCRFQGAVQLDVATANRLSQLLCHRCLRMSPRQALCLRIHNGVFQSLFPRRHQRCPKLRGTLRRFV
jgi:hypothetical protein